MNDWMNERKDSLSKSLGVTEIGIDQTVAWAVWVNQWMNGWMNWWMNKQMNESMIEWMNEWMNQWMKNWMNKKQMDKSKKLREKTIVIKSKPHGWV